MKRVSSRQRLVSWDAFDATAPETSSDVSDGEFSDYETAPMTAPSVDSEDSGATLRGRKRDRIRRSRSDVVPCFPWEIESLLPSLDDLNDDVLLHVFSFLDLDSLRHTMGVNHKYRLLLFSSDAHDLWVQHCQRQWTVPVDQASALVDNLHLPTAAGIFWRHDTNLPLLLSMTPSDLPRDVDKKLIRKQRRDWQQNQLETSVDETTGETLVRYTGAVGSGDRCIRADKPLPKPHRRFPWKTIPFTTHPKLSDLFCRGAKAVTGWKMSDWKPFVAPYVEDDNSIQVSPRMVAYYEVTIAEREQKVQEEDGIHYPAPPLSTPTSNAAECVAVGVATESFHVHSRMPGWDNQSFGYHGDDGGIFHSSGAMSERFGPCFGAGDTVGCGVDYVSRGIFFTLNGKFLGYAWKGIDSEYLSNPLYPVVGIDTNASMSLNFGAKPFQFDLTTFSARHEMLITPSYRLIGYDDEESYESSRSSRSSRSSKSGSFSRPRFHRRKRNHMIR